MAKKIEKLRLNSVVNTRKTVARYLRLLQAEDESTIDFKKHELILSYLREYRLTFKLEKEGAVAEDIETLKAILREKGIMK
jgi:hypothetical protein